MVMKKKFSHGTCSFYFNGKNVGGHAFSLESRTNYRFSFMIILNEIPIACTWFRGSTDIHWSDPLNNLYREAATGRGMWRLYAKLLLETIYFESLRHDRIQNGWYCLVSFLYDMMNQYKILRRYLSKKKKNYEGFILNFWDTFY